MAFSADDKAIIKHYVEKGYSGYQICKQNPERKWNEVKRKVYDGRLKRPFESEDEMIAKIKAVWKECATNLKPLRKSMKEFVGRLTAVHECNGSSIKMIYS